MTPTTPDRSVLVVCRSAPYGSSRARDAIDLAMAFAAFDQPVTLLFLGDGVFTLSAAQQPPAGTRHLGKLLGTLADYGIEDVYVDAAALATRGLDACSLELAATPAHESTLRELFTTHQRVITV